MTESTPVISVMILTYNHEKYIRQAVESILMQECSYSYEIVICDDCSTDNTRNICTKLQKEHPDKIRLIFNESNKGLIRNYFETMQECRGKYIADCSGDDYWLTSSKLQKEADVLENRNDIVLVHTNWKDIVQHTGKVYDDVKSRREGWKSLILDKKDTEFYLNHRNLSLVNINTSCFRKDIALGIYKKYNRFFDPDLYMSEDFQLLFLMLYEGGSFYYIDEDTAIYRLLDESVSQSCCVSKKFRYRYRLTKLRVDLSNEFNVPISKFLSEESINLYYLAFKAKQKDFTIQTKSLLDSFGYKNVPLRAKFFYYIGLNKGATNITYCFYTIGKKIKRFFTKKRE